jgi:hypothetical protein
VAGSTEEESNLTGVTVALEIITMSDIKPTDDEFAETEEEKREREQEDAEAEAAAPGLSADVILYMLTHRKS